jgi:hypothetical protein
MQPSGVSDMAADANTSGGNPTSRRGLEPGLRGVGVGKGGASMAIQKVD